MFWPLCMHASGGWDVSIPFVHLRHKFWCELLYRELSARSGRPLCHPHRRELRSEAWQGVTLCLIPSALPLFIQCMVERISGAECLSGFGQSKSLRMKAVFLLLRTVLLPKCCRSKVGKFDLGFFQILKSCLYSNLYVHQRCIPVKKRLQRHWCWSPVVCLLVSEMTIRSSGSPPHLRLTVTPIFFFFPLTNSLSACPEMDMKQKRPSILEKLKSPFGYVEPCKTVSTIPHLKRQSLIWEGWKQSVSLPGP